MVGIGFWSLRLIMSTCSTKQGHSFISFSLKVFEWDWGVVKNGDNISVDNTLILGISGNCHFGQELLGCNPNPK